MSLIVDASVAVKWFVEEPDSDRARQLEFADEDLIAPDLALAEVGNALWKKAVRREFKRANLTSAM